MMRFDLKGTAMGRKFLALLLAAAMVFTLLPAAYAEDGATIDITGKNETTIATEITTALSGNDTVTVTGSKTDASATLYLTIPEGKTVVWRAEYATATDGWSIYISGNGTFEVAEGANISAQIRQNGDAPTIAVTGGTVSVTTGVAIDASWNSNSAVTVSGGTVRAIGENVCAIAAGGGTITITGGTVEAGCPDEHYLYNAIAISGLGGNITVTGGTVSVTDEADPTGGVDSAAIQFFARGTNSITVSGTAEVSASGNSATAIYVVDYGSGAAAVVTTTVSGTAEVSASGNDAAAIYVADFYTRDDTVVTTTVSGNAVVSATGDNGIAIRTEFDNTPVTVSGGTVSATGDAIEAEGDVTVEGGEVSTTGDWCAAIKAMGKITVENGTVRATGENGKAIIAFSGEDVIIKDDTVVSATGDQGKAIYSYGAVTVEGGAVSATTGTAIDAGGNVTVSGGVVFTYGSAITGENNVIYIPGSPSGFAGATGTGVVVAWNQSEGRTAYDEGLTTDLSVSPTGAAAWGLQSGESGIDYQNGTNTGFIPVGDVTVTALSVPVTGITVTGGSAISARGGALQLTANVTPANATNTGVTWSVASGEAYATVSSGGLVTATANGTATVRASAQDGSGVFGEIQITISGQSSGGGGATSPAYNAGIEGGGNVPVTVNAGAGSATVNLASLAGNLADGGSNTVIDVPAIPGVNAFTANLPASSLSGSGAGSLTLNTGVGNLTIPGNMLSGTGLTGSAGVTISEGDRDNLPDDLKAALGDRPLIQLTLTIDGQQTDWNNPDAPVTVAIPYTPTAEELANPEHITVWYIDSSGNAVSVEGGRYDPVSGTVTFTTTHFSDYAIVYDPVIRLSGTDRIGTALTIAQAAYPGKIANAVLATAGNYPDSLAGSVLAHKLKAPVLLAGSSEADQKKVLDYLKANLETGGTVYILGGPGVIGSGLEDKLKADGLQRIIRLAGEDRYETSVKIAELLEVQAGTPVVLVSGKNYPDALSVSSIAAQSGYPVFLVQKDRISEPVRQRIAALKPAKVYIVGLEGVIGANVENEAAELTGLAAAIVRIGGADRYATSLAVAQYFGPVESSSSDSSSQTVCVATGKNFPDTLAGCIYAARQKAPIILADGNLSQPAIDYLKSAKPAKAAIFGGESAVGGDIERQLRQLTGQ